MKARAMAVAGVMSGTSADGVDVAVVRIAPGRLRPRLELLVHEGFAYPAALRRAVLEAMNATAISTAELARLNWRLGLEYAEAVSATVERHKVKLELVGCHGQTLYHQARAEAYAGRRFACTWQAGEAQAIAERVGVPVVSNFRPADMLVGGQGAPLVPLLDYVLFADARRGRVLQNIGGIANLTAIPAGAGADRVMAFDTGPGNMVMDALAMEMFGKNFDRGGRLAAEGTVLEPVLKWALGNPYFRMRPPRTAGREQFGRDYAAKFQAKCLRFSKKPEDAMATAVALTAETIAESYAQFVKPQMKRRRPKTVSASGAKATNNSAVGMYGLKPAPFTLKPVASNAIAGARSSSTGAVDFIVSGGGARNATLMAMLASRLEPLGCELAASEDFGLPVEAKEAAAFALLAWQTWHRLPGNVPAATGARQGVVLGQVTYV